MEVGVQYSCLTEIHVSFCFMILLFSVFLWSGLLEKSLLAKLPPLFIQSSQSPVSSGLIEKVHAAAALPESSLSKSLKEAGWTPYSFVLLEGWAIQT